MAILKVQQCQKTRDKIKTAYETIQPEEQSMTEINGEVNEYYSNLTSVSDNY